MKAAVSIPDDGFRRVERLAKRRQVSRSQLYTAALIPLLEAEPKGEPTRAACGDRALVRPATRSTPG